ncbi:MAG: CRISPR-associated protein (Cas_CXXC_CXXC) [candidate division TA06 bacterium ADurb.Bin131]|uniref:CRISPR-associated protein (Cas_CXXC_CXXC) n=1 Tax=candidate division TA06 bacterium ADurb.Bin131 TaxID=1852827 RepID=A0A1V6C9I0_UNCT6|nr:MAG: CRISPR-associated protein (Cas_CXXC_CXXC) [candidate division TA06 bacterium ADurb.Bin131]
MLVQKAMPPKNRVYLKDWYFNAGIIGFLTIVADNREIDSIPSLIVDKNYIEFDNTVLDGFEEKFIKKGFLKFFDVQTYVNRLQKIHDDLKKTRTEPDSITKKIKEIEKNPYKDFLKLLNISITEYQDIDKFLGNLENVKKTIESLSKEQVYNKLNSTTDGRIFLNEFVNLKLKGICSSKSIPDYITQIKTATSKKPKNNDLCLFCQERKASKEFSNAISNIIGFNTDNSNWIWGYKTSKLKVCPMCALIYNCAFASFAYTLRKVGENYLNYFYFPNENTNLIVLFEIVTRFNLELENIKDNTTPLYIMIKQVVSRIMARQLNSINENLNFIEIVDNPILAGQSSKGYNVYNYNIDTDIAEFLDSQFKSDGVPKGFYKLKDTYYKVDEELLKLTIQRLIDYSILHRYFAYALNPDRYTTGYSLNKIVRFVFGYIKKMRGDTMEKSEKIIDKGFKSGVSVRDELIKKDKENQINGLVYGFLNDLKIADREKFLDKYIRVVMSHNLPNLFGKEEMLDKDCFLQFGYSFVNGLMSHKGTDKTKNNNE